MAASPDGRGQDRHARGQFNCAVDRAGTIKLTYWWGGDEPAVRFKSPFSREAERCRSERASGGSASSVAR